MHALHQVLHAFFNLQSFVKAMPDVWAGFQINLRIMVKAEVLVLVLALGVFLPIWDLGKAAIAHK